MPHAEGSIYDLDWVAQAHRALGPLRRDIGQVHQDLAGARQTVRPEDVNVYDAGQSRIIAGAEVQPDFAASWAGLTS